MFVVVAGCGRLGAGLARVLSSQGHDVVIVGEDIDSRRLGGEFDGITVSGSPIDEELLEGAGIGKADLFVAATADDRLNAMAAQIARETFRVPTVLARISDPAMEAFYRGLGVDTVCPTQTAINQILDLIRDRSYPTLRGYIDPDLVGVRPPEEWVGRALRDLDMPEGRIAAGVVSPVPDRNFDQGRAIGPDDLVLIRRSPWRRDQP